MASNATAAKNRENKLRIGPLLPGTYYKIAGAWTKVCESRARPISVRGAGCCGSALGGCGLEALAGVFLGRGGRAGACGVPWGRSSRRNVIFCYTLSVEKCVQKAGDFLPLFLF